MQIVFTDSHNKCGKYSTQIKPKDGQLQTTICLNHLPLRDSNTADVIQGHGSLSSAQSRLETSTIPNEPEPKDPKPNKRPLDPNGYK